MKLRSDKKGFTLIELLIALSLLVAVVFVLYRFLEVGNKTFNQQTSEITAANEMRDAMDIILLECRKGYTYSAADKSITCKTYVVTFRLEGNTFKMIKTDRTTSVETETILGYDISSFTFDVGAERINIALYSDVKDLSGNNLKIESVYYMR
ncbi:MAG: prepilin-type N-terminal cleavage/methylation domain-containing protein [Lachnospiraceae bacterium]|nr:prepilin-type N-terminal cleavage/methylation domain-containing protein [Lachnospiraceae bacterium]